MEPRYGKVHVTKSYFDGQLKSERKVQEESLAIENASELFKELMAGAAIVVKGETPCVTLEVHDDRAGGRFIRLVKKWELK